MGTFHRMLGEMCRSGVPLGRALGTLGAEFRRGPLRDAAAEMGREVEGGVPLADAWRVRQGLFPPVYAALLEAGIATGDLPGTLDAIARHASLRADTTRRLRRATAYPLVVLGLLAAVSCFLFALVLPRLAELFALVEQWSGRPFRLPPLTLFFLDYPWAGAVPPLLMAGLFVLFGRLRNPVDGLRIPLSLRDRLPVLGPLRIHAALQVFATTLATLVRRGVPLHRGLELAGAAADHGALASAAAAAATDVHGGSPFPEVARARGLLPPSMAWVLAGGGGDDALARGLDDVGRIAGERFERGMEGFTWAVEPIFQLLAGALVLVILLAVYGPILRMTSAVWRVDRFF